MTSREQTAVSSVDLAISGMTCASCAARIEKKLNKLDGVAASVNFATETAHVDFPASLPQTRLIEQVEAAGYGASVEPTEADDLALLQRRLIVAVVLAVPVIAVAMVPPWQFDGWQWWSLVLATPVVAWCGWPFHRAAAANLRHGAATMDTLISLGTLAAFGWSLWALGPVPK